MLKKNSLCIFSVSTEELLGKHNFNTEDSKTIRVELVHNKKKLFFFCMYQGFKKTFLLLQIYIKVFIVPKVFIVFIVFYL